MCFRLNILFLFVLPFALNAQEDTVQHIQEMNVAVAINKIQILRYRNQNEFLGEKDIKMLATNDLGELLSRFAGVDLKSYGGLGGLKTISVRSLGSTHNTTVIDGFTESNGQTGQSNLGRIQTDNVVSVARTTSNSYAYLLPVSSQAAGANVALQTFENSFYGDSLMIRANVRYGSFNQKSTYLGAKVTRGKFYVSAFGRYRDAEGDFPYQFRNGNTIQNAIRKNNDYQDYYFGTGLGYHLRNIKFRFGYRGSASNQGLPGAVIFYNESADERMSNEDHTAFGDLTWSGTNVNIRLYSNANLNQLSYDDPSYLNSVNAISTSYENKMIKGGIVLARNVGDASSFRGGIEHTVSSLAVDDTSFAKPLRNHSHGMIGFDSNLSWGQISLALYGQYVDEFNRAGSQPDDLFRLNPFVSYTSRVTNKHLVKHKLWYRNSFRVPSFNELYYNNIGNQDLLPELAHQFNYGVDFVPWKDKIDLYVRTNLFLNLVENKILAIPTKNLFVWSMQNITNARIIGGEVYFDLEWNRNLWQRTISGNYTYQSVVDITDGSLNQGHQLAYTPEHKVNVDLSSFYKGWGFRLSNSFTSMRYALNENIEQNELPGFYLLDVGAYFMKTIRKNEFRIQLNVKNVLNNNYAYVRSYVMPGRNYLITMSYAFN